MNLILALVPYSLVLGYDVWLHKTHRYVSPREKLAHGFSIVLLLIFFISALTHYTTIAFIALSTALPIMVYDEVAFHKDLSKHEKMIHIIAFFCFMGFVGYWLYQL